MTSATGATVPDTGPETVLMIVMEVAFAALGDVIHLLAGAVTQDQNLVKDAGVPELGPGQDHVTGVEDPDPATVVLDHDLTTGARAASLTVRIASRGNRAANLGVVLAQSPSLDLGPGPTEGQSLAAAPQTDRQTKGMVVTTSSRRTGRIERTALPVLEVPTSCWHWAELSKFYYTFFSVIVDLLGTAVSFRMAPFNSSQQIRILC